MVHCAKLGLPTQCFDFGCFLPSIERSLGQIYQRAPELPFEGAFPSLGKDKPEMMILSEVLFQGMFRVHMWWMWLTEYVETVACFWALSGRIGCPRGNSRCLFNLALFSPFPPTSPPWPLFKIRILCLPTWKLPQLFSLSSFFSSPFLCFLPDTLFHWITCGLRAWVESNHETPSSVTLGKSFPLFCSLLCPKRKNNSYSILISSADQMVPGTKSMVVFSKCPPTLDSGSGHNGNCVLSDRRVRH